MQLINLRTIVEGIDSLAEIEKVHPKLGKDLLRFVNDISSCCEAAYDRLSKALGSVRDLPSNPTRREIEDISEQINQAPSSKWFKEVAGICDHLAALAVEFGPAISGQITYTSPFGENRVESYTNKEAYRYAAHYKIAPLFSLLQKHERELKDDIRNAVFEIQAKLGPAKDTGNVQDAREYAVKVQKEISTSLDEINKLRLQIAGSSSNGASIILTPSKIAEEALRRPERVLILNIFFLIFVVSLGAVIFQFLKAYQFILITTFAITAVIVVNAFYLKTIDKLSEENFLKLMELALLKFFAPLTKRKSSH